jgi:hypothetical protein
LFLVESQPVEMQYKIVVQPPFGRSAIATPGADLITVILPVQPAHFHAMSGLFPL